MFGIMITARTVWIDFTVIAYYGFTSPAVHPLGINRSFTKETWCQSGNHLMGDQFRFINALSNVIGNNIVSRAKLRGKSITAIKVKPVSNFCESSDNIARSMIVPPYRIGPLAA